MRTLVDIPKLTSQQRIRILSGLLLMVNKSFAPKILTALLTSRFEKQVEKTRKNRTASKKQLLITIIAYIIAMIETTSSAIVSSDTFFHAFRNSIHAIDASATLSVWDTTRNAATSMGTNGSLVLPTLSLPYLSCYSFWTSRVIKSHTNYTN